MIDALADISFVVMIIGVLVVLSAFAHNHHH
jgi:hypothetical protein